MRITYRIRTGFSTVAGAFAPAVVSHANRELDSKTDDDSENLDFAVKDALKSDSIFSARKKISEQTKMSNLLLLIRENSELDFTDIDKTFSGAIITANEPAGIVQMRAETNKISVECFTTGLSHHSLRTFVTFFFLKKKKGKRSVHLCCIDRFPFYFLKKRKMVSALAFSFFFCAPLV